MLTRTISKKRPHYLDSKPPALSIIQLSIDRSGSVVDLKQRIEEESAIPARIQVLLWNGKLLNDGVLEDLGLQHLDMIILTLTLSGGSQSKKPHKRKNPRTQKTMKLGSRTRDT